MRSSCTVQISIHAPREGSDPVPRPPTIQIKVFQSTLPARGATRCPRVADFPVIISIHAPREGSDGILYICVSVTPPFQSTLPARGATLAYHYCRCKQNISIHAPREGSDQYLDNSVHFHINFNPRSPRGERPKNYLPVRQPATFQSTLPARGATANVHRFLDKICTVCIKNRAFFSQCLIQTTSNAESVGKTRCYFGANLQAFIDSLYFALLQNQHFFWHIRGFASKMLYFVFVTVPKIIET